MHHVNGREGGGGTFSLYYDRAFESGEESWETEPGKRRLCNSLMASGPPFSTRWAIVTSAAVLFNTTTPRPFSRNETRHKCRYFPKQQMSIMEIIFIAEPLICCKALSLDCIMLYRIVWYGEISNVPTLAILCLLSRFMRLRASCIVNIVIA